MLSLRWFDAVLLVVGGYLLYKLASLAYETIRAHVKTTKLCGPPSTHWFYGVGRELYGTESLKDFVQLIENWAKEYGPVFQIPTLAGAKKIVLTDPKAINYVYSLDSWTYTHTTMTKKSFEMLVGRGILYFDGEYHKTLRRAMTPPFSNVSIRSFIHIFYDCGYKVKAAWDTQLEASSTDDIVEDVAMWMNRVSLDSIGRAGFAHAFGTLDGKRAEITEIFDTHSKPSRFSILLLMWAAFFPPLLRLPNSRTKLLRKLNDGTTAIAQALLRRTREEKALTEDYKYSPGQSIVGAFIKAEHAGMSEQDVVRLTQMLILAGYETTSMSLTWTLLELATHPDKQEKLRAELEGFTTTDPTYDDFAGGLPYLTAVTKEVLRLYPPVTEATRVALEDGIVPLSAPVRTASGEAVDHLFVAKGALLSIPIRSLQTSVALWGPDAKEFKPERWIDEDGIPPEVQVLQGYSHLLTFSDGPRICLGKSFALTEFKSVLSVLIRNYRFALRDGPGTQFGLHRGFLPRPMILGEEGAKVPLRIFRV